MRSYARSNGKSTLRTWLSLGAITLVASAGTLPRPSLQDQVRTLDASRSTRDRGRIIGTSAEYSDNPWQVALVDSNIPNNFDAQFCGGVYLGGNWVVTAAHCISKPPADMDIYYGSGTLDNSGHRVSVVEITKNPNFGTTNFNNLEVYNSDIALLKLSSSLGTTPVAPLTAAGEPKLTSGAVIRVTGWGWVDNVGTAARHLMQAQLPLQTNGLCNAGDAYDNHVTNQEICAGKPEGGDAACFGDSGGPATADIDGQRKLVGLVSWGQGCGTAKRYGIYARVSKFEPWIASVTHLAI